MKDVGGIQTLFENSICPVPSGNGEGAKDVGGVRVPDGQKGVSGSMPQVNGVSLRDDSSPGLNRPPHMAGS